MRILFLKQADRELRDAPKEIVERLFPLLEELSQGKLLGMPISRPLSSIARGLHELRLSAASGEYRIFYVIKTNDGIFIIHVSHKKTQKASRQTIDLLKSRLRQLEHL